MVKQFPGLLRRQIRDCRNLSISYDFILSNPVPTLFRSSIKLQKSFTKTEVDKNVHSLPSLLSIKEKCDLIQLLLSISEKVRLMASSGSLTNFSPLTYYDNLNQGGCLMGFVISPKELKSRLDKGDPLVLVDVREEWEYSLAKLDGSILIPLGTLPQSLTRLTRDSEIIAICHHGMRSADATNFLLQQGFPNVKNLVGGINAWSIQVDGTVPRY
jgi:rhodanese-related sulfurtransferase